MTNKVTKQEIRSAIRITQALGHTIRELGSIPSGQLYAQVMGRLTLPEYNAAIGVLVHADVITRGADNVLTWKGHPDL